VEAAARAAGDAAEVAARVAADVLEQDAATAATDAELSAAVGTLNTAIGLKLNAAEKAAASGVASLSSGSRVVQSPKLHATDHQPGGTDALAIDAAAATASLRTLGTGVAQAAMGSVAEAHRVDTANPHAVTKAQVGLGSADNTADSAKPVSTAQAAAIALKPTRDLREFGATFDGVTADTVAVDAGIAWATANGGGILTGPTGKTLVTAGGHVLGPGVQIALSGISSSRIKHTGNNACFTYTEGGSPTGVQSGGLSGFTLLGNSGASAVGIKVYDQYGCRLENLLIGSRTAGDQYSAGIAVLLRIEVYWCEATILHNVTSMRNAVGIRFERTEAGAANTHNSFGYTSMRDVSIQVPTNGTGIDFGGPSNLYSLIYNAYLDAHLWVGVAGDGTTGGIGVRVRSNAEIPPNTWANIRIEPKGGGSGNFTVQNDGGKLNAAGGIRRWVDASATENRAGGQTLMHGPLTGLALAPGVAAPCALGLTDAWAQTHAQIGFTVQTNEETPYLAGFSFTGKPITRFVAKAFTADPGAPWDVDATTKAWIRADGAVCIGTIADCRVIDASSADPEGAITGSRGDIHLRKINTGQSIYTKASGDATNTGWVNIGGLKASAAWDPASTLTGAVSSAKTVSVTGAAVGDFAQASFSIALPTGCYLTAEVTATNTVSVYLVNLSGSTQDVASGTVGARVIKAT
jgi:hypothetical protein